MTFIDIAKGVAMLLVVMHHCGGNLDRGMGIITIIDVPLFSYAVATLLISHPTHIDGNLLKRQRESSSRLSSQCVSSACGAAKM